MRVALFCILYTLNVHAAETEIGRVISAHGTVLLNQKPAQSGDYLREHASIRTKDGEAVLLLMKNVVIQISKDSSFQVPTQNEFKLNRGNLRAMIRSQPGQNFQFHNKGVVMGVRGTDIGISSNGKLMVFEGNVELKSTANNSAAPVVLKTGESISTAALNSSTEAAPQKQDAQQLKNEFQGQFQSTLESGGKESMQAHLQLDQKVEMPELPKVSRDPTLDSSGSLEIDASLSGRSSWQ